MIFKFARQFIKGPPPVKLIQFQSVMKTGQQLLAASNIEGLRDLIRILLRPIQARHIREAYLNGAHGGLPSLEWEAAL